VAIKVGGITFAIKADISQAQKSFVTLGRAQKNLQNDLRQTTTLFSGLGNNFQPILQAFQGFNKSSQQTQGALANLTNQFAQFQRQTQTVGARNAPLPRATQAISGTTKALLGLGGALAVVASAFTALRLFSFTREATELAARVENLGTVLDNVGRIAGRNAAQIQNVENSVKALGITTRAARQSLTQLAQANLDLRKATDLTRIAQDAAVIAGVDSSEAFNRLVVSIQRNDVRLLRNLGIVINLNSVYNKFAQQTGRTAASLTAFEKRQLLLNEVLERGTLIQGTYEASLNDVFKRMTSMRRLIEEATLAFGKQFIPVLEVVVDKMSRLFKAFAESDSVLPRLVASIVAFGAAATVLTPILGGIVAVFAAYKVAAGVVASATVAAAAGTTTLATGAAALAAAVAPVAAALGVIGIILAAGVALWVNQSLAVKQLEQAMRDTEGQAKRTTQAIADQGEVIQKLRDFAQREEGIGISNMLDVDEAREVRAEAERLAKAFPELSDAFEEAVEQELVARDKVSNQRANDLALLENQLKRGTISVEEAADERAAIAARFEEDSSLAAIGTAQAVIDVFGKNLPEALVTAEQRLDIFQARQIQAEKSFTNELLRIRTAQLTSDIRPAGVGFGRAASEQRREARETTAAVAQAQREVRAALAGGTEAFIKQNPLISQGTEELAKFSNEMLAAAASIEQTEAAIVQADFEAFEAGLANLTQAANQAVQIFQKLETARVRAFRDPNVKLIADFLKNQNQLLNVELRTTEDLKEASEALGRAQRLASTQAQVDAQDEIDLLEKKSTILGRLFGISATDDELKAKREKVDKKARRDQARIIAQQLALETDGAEEQNTVLKARRANVEAQIIALNRQADATRVLQELESLEANNISPTLIRLRKKFLEETNRLTSGTFELGNSLDAISTKLINAGFGPLLEQLRTLDEVPEEFLDELQGEVGNLVNEFIVVNKAFSQNQEELARSRDKLATEFANARAKERTKLIEEERKLNTKILMLTEEGRQQIADTTLAGLNKQFEDLKASSEKAESFLEKLQTRFSKAGGSTKGITSDFKDLKEAISQTSTAANAKALREFFPKLVQDRIRAAKVELQAARDALKEFQQVGRAEQAGEDREKRAQRFNELTQAGVRPQVIQAEIEELRLRQVAEREKKEKDLQAEVKTAEQARRDNLVANKQLTRDINTALDDQLMKVQGINELRERRSVLLAEETEHLERQRQAIVQKQEAMEMFIPGTGGEQVPFVQPPPAAPEPGVSQATLDALEQEAKKRERLVKELDLLSEVIAGSDEVTVANADLVQSIRERLVREAREGRRAFDAVKGGRR
jgi:hypothetical protein